MNYVSSLRPSFTLSALALAVLATLPAQAAAAPLGKLRTVSAGQSDGPSWDLVADSGARVRVSLPRADVLRIQAGRKELSGPGDKAAPIGHAAAGDEGNFQLVRRAR